MVPLINADDKKILANSEFLKNAIFYKDMLAFYDAYAKIMSFSRDRLPNYCFNEKKGYLLDGICLLIKNYASEFKFESIKLSLEYLKVLYYTIVSYSKDNNLPDKNLIINEFEDYKMASIKIAEDEKKSYDEKYDRYLELQDDYDIYTSKYAKGLVGSQLYNGLSIAFMILGFFAGILVFGIHYMGKLSELFAYILGGSCVAVGAIVSTIFKIASKKTSRKAGDTSYVIQNKKRKKDEVQDEVLSVKNKYNKIIVEKHEYKSNFAEELEKFTKHITFEELITRAAEYKLLSYNIKNDINSLFETQKKETAEILSQIDSINKKSDSTKQLQECYKAIAEKDWLYFSNEVRFSYLRKFAESAEKTYEWKVEFEGKKINPFGINIKAIAKEQITYLKSKKDLFVSASLDKFMNTNYIKNTKVLELKGLNDIESIKNMKVEYLSKFLDYESTKRYDNLFYDKKIIDGVKVSNEIIEQNQKIPTYINLKLKMVEAKLGFTNSDSMVIKQIAADIAKIESGVKIVSIIEPILEDNIETYTHTETIEDFGDYIKYNVGGDSFIGYKI